MRVTSIIVTRGRVDLLTRAIRSLTAQVGTAIELRVVIDDCQTTLDYLQGSARIAGAVRSLEWQYLNRYKSERSGPIRVATLREAGLAIVQTPYCAFLDDDNELEPHHYSLLASCIAEWRSVAAHSWRTLWTRQGAPYPLSDCHPWSRDLEVARQMFDHYCQTGIYQPNSQVVRDQVVPHCREKSMVDTSEWLFDTSFLREIKFAKQYSRDDWLLSRAEDNKLLDSIVESGVMIPSTCRPTLRYYLGGYSNDWAQEAAQLEGWVLPQEDSEPGR